MCMLTWEADFTRFSDRAPDRHSEFDDYAEFTAPAGSNQAAVIVLVLALSFAVLVLLLESAAINPGRSTILQIVVLE